MPKKSRSKSLAKPGDPLVLADGVEVTPEPLAGEEPAPPQGLSATNFKPTKKRSLKELPAGIPMVKAVSCVFMMTALGVGDREIAVGLGITPTELATIRKHPAYKECFDTVLEEFVSVHSNLLQARIAAYGAHAVDNIMGIAKSGKKEETRLRANIDIADRAGVGAKKNDQSKLGLHDLHITITKNQQADNIDVHINPSM